MGGVACILAAAAGSAVLSPRGRSALGRVRVRQA